MVKKSLCVILALSLLLLCSCGLNGSKEQSTYNSKGQLVSEEESTTQKKVTCPIDFSDYRSVNREVYAYIVVPGTNIEYPIVQSSQDDNYYLRRTWDDKPNYKGTIFTQSMNSKYFDDPVTMVYGHHTDKGDMFSQLLKYKDASFFNKNNIFYIYTEECVYTYAIVSAFEFDTTHILNAYDFNDPAVITDFFNMLMNPYSLVKNVNENVTLTEYSYATILSTCVEARSGCEERFLVAGKLINIESYN